MRQIAVIRKTESKKGKSSSGSDQSTNKSKTSSEESTNEPKTSSEDMSTRPKNSSVDPTKPLTNKKKISDDRNASSSPSIPKSSQHSITSIPPSSLIRAVDELLEAGGSKEVLGEYYGDVRELIWKLKGILNKVTGGESASLEAQSILDVLNHCSCQEVQAILRAEVTNNLIRKAAETSARSVCTDITSVLGELATRDSHFVSMIFGLLYRQCPLLIPEMPEQSSLSDRAFEDKMKNYSMLVVLFCSLCSYRSSKGTNPFNLSYIWYWINELNELALKQTLLEYSGMVEPLFSSLGGVLSQKYPKSFRELLQFTKNSILPKLQRIPGKTAGQIYRLESTLNRIMV